MFLHTSVTKNYAGSGQTQQMVPPIICRRPGDVERRKETREETHQLGSGDRPAPWFTAEEFFPEDPSIPAAWRENINHSHLSKLCRACRHKSPELS